MAGYKINLYRYVRVDDEMESYQSLMDKIQESREEGIDEKSGVAKGAGTGQKKEIHIFRRVLKVVVTSFCLLD